MAVSAVLAVAVSATWVATAAGADGLVSLQLRLKKGETYNLRMLMVQKISQTIQGQKMDMDQTMGMGMAFSVTDVRPDGVQDVSVVYDWMKLKQDSVMGGQKMMSIEYDSSNPPATLSPAAQGFAALIGLGFKISLAPDGTVAAISGIPEMIESMMKKLNMPAGPMLDNIKSSLTKQFNDESMRQNIGQMVAAYPPNPIAIGGTWNKTLTMTMMGSMVIESTYTLKEVRDGVATIGYTATITPGKEASPLEIGGAKTTYAIEGTQEGDTQVDVATGWTVGGHITQELSGTINMDQGGAKQSWPISIKSDITIMPKPEEAK
jgi:hypothetical protein